MAFLRMILTGKKTYLVAGLLLLATVVLLGVGKLTVTTALALVMFAVSLFPVTFRAQLERHQAETLLLLGQIAAGGIALAGKNLPAAERDGEAAAATGLRLVSELHESGGVDPRGVAVQVNIAQRLAGPSDASGGKS
jgi:hypothetical protein